MCRPYIFSTEAHPFESTQIHFSDIRGLASNTSSNTTDNTTSTGGAEGSADASSAAVTAVVPVPAKDVQTAGASAITGGKKKKQKRKGKPDVATSILDEVHRHHHSMLQSLKQGAHNVQVLPIEQLQEQLQAMATAATAATAITATAPALPPVMTTSVPNHGIAGQNGLPRQHPHGAYMLPLKCRKPQWWDRPASYDHAFLQEINRNLRKEAFQAKADHPRKIRHSPRNVNLKHTVAGAAVGDGVRTGIGGTIRPSGRAGPLRLSAQPSAAMVSRITLVLLDLIQNLQADAEKIAKLRSRGGAPTTTPTSPSASPTSPSSSSSSSLPAPALVPKVTKLKWYETKSPLFSHDICTLAEQPNGKKSAGKKGKQGGATASSAADATAAPVLEPLKSVKVNMGPLGEFQINVYTDGFFIYSEQDDIQVEISNVGHSLVLLRENVQDLKSEVVMADVNAHATTTCRVQISRTGEDDGAGAVGSPRTATTIFDR